MTPVFFGAFLQKNPKSSHAFSNNHVVVSFDHVFQTPLTRSSTCLKIISSTMKNPLFCVKLIYLRMYKMASLVRSTKEINIV